MFGINKIKNFFDNHPEIKFKLLTSLRIGLADEDINLNTLGYPKIRENLDISPAKKKGIVDILQSRSGGEEAVSKHIETILSSEKVSSSKIIDILFYCMRVFKYAKGHAPDIISKACANLLDVPDIK